MDICSEISTLLGDLVSIATKLCYPDSSICVLNGDETNLKNKYPEIFKKLESCRYNSDKRSPIKYGQDLVASWVYEDFLISTLTDMGLQIKKTGTDRNREILANTDISASSDCTVTYNEISRKLELMSDYKCCWNKYKKIDFRDKKYIKMCDEKAIFLGVAPLKHQYVILDFSIKPKAKLIPHHYPYGNKPVYQIKIMKSNLQNIDFKKIAEEIQNLLKTVPTSNERT